MIRILVVDDQKTVHQAIKSYLLSESDLEIVGFATNGQEAIAQVEKLKPDIALMDIQMPIKNGLEATKIIAERFVSTKVLMLTSCDDEYYLNSALQMGAKGYLLKSTPPQMLIGAIRYAHQGYFQLGPDLVERYISKIPRLEAETNEIDRLKETLQLHATHTAKIQQEIKRISDDDNRLVVARYTNLQLKIDKLTQHTRKIDKRTIFLHRLFLVNVLLLFFVIIGTIYTVTRTWQ